jgi:hypothetical protein
MVFLFGNIIHFKLKINHFKNTTFKQHNNKCIVQFGNKEE